MDERIRELYIQTSNETADGKEWAIGGLNNAKRFAELIVAECTKILADNSEFRGCVIISKHFGVES